MYLDYKTHKAGVYVIDIETDSLSPSVIWVMCWRNILTGERGECTTIEAIKAFLDDHKNSIFIGHNILKFDGPVLNRLAGSSTILGPSNCIDTLVLSTLYSPSIDGGHSLDSWGERIGEAKTEFNDWSGLSQEMINYCHQDVLVTAKLFVRLIKTMEKIGFTEGAIWLQHNITDVLRRQQQNGFYFNQQEAMVLYSQLRRLEQGLQDEVREVFPARRVLVATRRRYKKDGGASSIYLKDQERYIIGPGDTGDTYRAYEFVEFNLGSPKQRIDKLLSLGWTPRTFTDKGNPKPFDKGDLSPCLKDFLEDKPTPEVELIARWMAYNGRANMVNTWLDNYNENTGCIHGKLFVADTLRFRHQAPNTANIPGVRISKDHQVLRGVDGFFTYEARDLWRARPGRLLVGTDAAGLELRMLAHFLNRPEFTEQVVDGDPHQYNADIAGITRPQAKTLIYATLYGAGDAKIAKTLGLSLKDGGDIKRTFLEALGADKLIEECKHEQRSGRIHLVDGSLVVCPSGHAALNYKLQGSGARVMAFGAVLLERAIQSSGLDSLKVGDIHDEWQYDVDPDDADDHAEAAIQAIRLAGQRLRLNVPLDGTSKKGLTWAETH
jgi:DNA polymerase I